MTAHIPFTAGLLYWDDPELIRRRPDIPNGPVVFVRGPRSVLFAAAPGVKAMHDIGPRVCA